jgi:6-phosphofructokinase 1
MTKYIGILTAGGDSPGLNAAIRGIGKSAANGRSDSSEIRVIGFRDGFHGLMENRTMRLEAERRVGASLGD